MHVAMLGRDYQYGLNPYYRERLGEDTATSETPPKSSTEAVSRINTAIDTLGTAADRILDLWAKKAVTDAEVDAIKIAANQYTNRTGLVPPLSFGAAAPWLIGGGVLIIGLLVIMGTRRRR